jgi:hypothetical protein
MDFSGWLEVYVGGAWYTRDARHNRPRIGRLIMARGRDAVDVALTTSVGATTLTAFSVWSYPGRREADVVNWRRRRAR